MALGVLMALMLAQAGAPAASEKPAAEPVKAEKPKKICVEEAQIGSHFKKRICATPEAWEKRRLADQAILQRGANTPTK